MAVEGSFEGWAILELMGHRKLGGLLSEATIGGGSFIRIDIPSEPPSTQFYAPGSVYCITPTTEDVARAAAQSFHASPVQRWELPALKAPEPATAMCRGCGFDDRPLDEDGYCTSCDAR